MSGDKDDDDKQYEASQQKLDEARKKGDFPRSIDLNTSAANAGLLIAGASIGGVSLMKIGSVLSGLLGRSDSLSRDVFEGSGAPMMGGLLRDVGINIAPWFAIPALFVILSIILQRGFVFAPSKLELKLSRISPIEQAKNKFGRSG